MQNKIDKIKPAIEPVIIDLNYNLVDIIIVNSEPKVLRIIIESQDDKNIDIDDCVKVTRAISAIIDMLDPISGHYSLEVSSPGIPNKLISLDDYKDNVGLEVRMRLRLPINGENKIKGEIKGVSEQGIINVLALDGTNYNIDFDNIRSSSVVLN